MTAHKFHCPRETARVMTLAIWLCSFTLAMPTGQFAIDASAKQAFEKTYHTVSPKKAFAVGKSGYGFSSTIVNQEDANLAALISCNQAVTGLSYPKSGKHECSLYAVGDKTKTDLDFEQS